MTVLITGISGFVGKHLKELIEKRGDRVIGYDIKDGQDLLDYEQLRNFLDKERPDEIYHLAAQAFVPESFSDPNRTIAVNVNGTINLLEAVKNLGLNPKVLLACSSEEYGFVKPEECPITEDQPLRPQSPYGVSKVACDMLGQWYVDKYDMHIVRTRAFNHTGPGRGEMYVTSSFAKQVAQIEKYGGKLKHGNLDAVRDFTDVRDIVRAYSLAINLKSDVYNIGSGKGIKIKEVLDILVDNENRDPKISFEVDKSRMRKTDVPRLVCDCTKFKKLSGWKPNYKIEETLSDLLEFWRARI